MRSSLAIPTTCLLATLQAQDAPPAGVDLTEDQHGSLRDVAGATRDRLDDWIDRFALSGFVAARFFDTERGGSRPDGALLIQAASLFVDANVKDVGEVFVELRLDYYPYDDETGVGLAETYMAFRDVVALDAHTGLGLKVGRFDLPFGEYYNYEDPDKNRLIGFPAAIPYRWDEGIEAFADFGTWGFTAALTDGSYSRTSSPGIAPAVTARLHARPADGLYLSASGLYIAGSPQSALCFGGSVITPVGGGIAGASPSTEVKSLLGSVDLDWQITEALHLQASAGTGRIDDAVDAFDRNIHWWMLEPTLQLSPTWQTTLRWSGAGTFDSEKGYQFEGRPYANGNASYGFDLAQLQRVALGLHHTFAPGLIGKVEVGFDRLAAVAGSGLPTDTRGFTGAELVLSF